MKDAKERAFKNFRLGAEKATSSDRKTVFSSQTTQRQCCSSSLEGRSDFMSPANHTRSKQENAATNLTKVVSVDARLDSWPAPQWWRAAPQPASWFEGARAPHVMNIPFERAHQASDMVTFKRNWPSFAVLVWIPPPPPRQNKISIFPFERKKKKKAQTAFRVCVCTILFYTTVEFHSNIRRGQILTEASIVIILKKK